MLRSAMAFKAVKAKSKTRFKDARSVMPCLILLLSGMTLLFLLFYAVLKQ